MHRLFVATTVVALSILLPASPCRARVRDERPPSLRDRGALATLLDPIVSREMERLHVPGAAVAVVKDGRVVFARGYGFASLESKRPVDADRTIFRIGSITKAFTATALVQLADRRRIALDEDVNRYLTAVEVPDTYPSPVTFANLLTHTAGFDEISAGRKADRPEDVAPLGEFLRGRLIRRKPPGEYISYSTYGISLAGHLVETISGLHLRDYLRKNVFDPLAMRRTSLGAVPRALRADLAVGYEYTDAGHIPLAFEYFHTYPASDVNGTATDMARFMMAHLDGGRYGRARILGERATRAMHERHFANDPRLLGMTYGFFENRQNGVRAIEHAGVMDGFSALLYLAPSERLGVFVACNREEGGLQQAVKAAILDRFYPSDAGPAAPKALPDKRLERFAGSYRGDHYCHSCATGDRGYLPPAFEIVANDDGTIGFWGGRWRQTEPLLFRLVSGRLDNGETVVAFREDRDGRVTHMFNGIWSHERLGDGAARREGVQFDPSLYDAYVGVYEIAPGRLVTVSREGGRLFGEMSGHPKVELVPTSETRFVAEVADAEITFVRAAGDRASEIVLRLSRREMRAKRIR